MNKKRFWRKHISYILVIIMVLSSFITANKVSKVKADNKKTSSFNIDNPPKNEIEKLYYGYNVTGGKDLLEPDALQTTYPIIDPDSDYKNYIKAFTGSKGDGKSYQGHNHKEVVNAYVKEQIFSAYGDIYLVNAEVSTKFNTGNKVNNAYTEWYEIYTKWINRHYYIVQLSTSEIRQFLSKRFVDDLYSIKNEYDAKRILETYGTHLNTGYQFGGRMIITNYMSSSAEDKVYEDRKEIGQRLEMQYGIDLGENGSYSEEELTQERTDFDSTSYSCVIYGGDSNIPQRVEDLFKYTESLVSNDNSGFYYTKWENSINADKNLVIIGIPNGAQSIPLWKLLDDDNPNSAEIQQYLVDAYLNMCGEKYEEYEKQYPYLEKTASKSTKETSVYIKEIYVATSNSYFYKVDIEDFENDGQHYGIHPGNYLFLNFEFDYGEKREIPEIECTGGKIIDEKKGIFQITGDADRFKIKVKKKTIIDIPIITCDFEGGMGNADYPYIIINAKQFKNISENKQAYYKLFSDINFEGETISSLGDFSGELDGNYCSISNFIIKENTNWGLFGVNNGTIKNLKIINAGTSTNEEKFSLGGVNYSEDYKNTEDSDSYKKFETNSVYAKNAGVLCSENKGTISNCYFSNIFIRNVIRNKTDYVRSNCVNICVGVIAGINNGGKISQCLVKDSRILDAFICDKGISIDVGTYAGGIVGLLHGGEIDSCVYDSGSKGTIMSITVMDFDNGDPTPSGNTINSFSGGIAGLCDNNAMVKSCYSYIRNIPEIDAYQAVDAEYIILDWRDSRADHRHALRTASIICFDNVSLNAEYNYAYTEDTNNVESQCIKPTDNGNIREDKNIYDTIGYFEEKKITAEEEFNSMNLRKTNIKYDNNSISHFSHILAYDRSGYIKITKDINDKKDFSECYVGERYTPYNINLKIKYGDNESEDLKIFRLYIKDGDFDYLVPRNRKLTVNSDEQYKAEIYPYHYNIENISYKCNLQLIDSDIAYITIDTSNREKYTIYYDEVEQYFNKWSLANIDLYKIMTDGKQIKIEGEEIEKAVSVLKRVDDISYGENVVQVSYITDKDIKTAKYILNVKKRDIEEIKILKKPIRTTYTVESDEKINLQGMEVLIKFSEGDDRVLSDVSDINKFEIIGSVSSIGDNTIYLSYGNYNKTVELVLTGMEGTVSITPTTEPVVSEYPDSTENVIPEPDNTIVTDIPSEESEHVPTIAPDTPSISLSEEENESSPLVLIALSIFAIVVIIVIVVFGSKYFRSKKNDIESSINKIIENKESDEDEQKEEDDNDEEKNVETKESDKDKSGLK